MIIGTVAGFMATNTSMGALRGLLVSTFAIAPGTYWLKKQGALALMGHHQPIDIFYENDVTPEEMERIRMMDEVENLATNMSRIPGYGIVHKGRSGHGLGL